MKFGERSVYLNNVYIHKSGVVVGPVEKEGPLGNLFDYALDDLHFDEKSWEKAEIKMFDKALNICLQKNYITKNNVDLFVHGDLNNQLIIGSYCLRNYPFSTIGVFSACASFNESIIVASNLIEGGDFKNIMVGVSSHNCSAEKQFRYPIEYGGQKPDTTTYTVTAACVVLLSSIKSNIRISRVTIGKVCDNEIKDPNDMGRVMAISAYDTFKSHFEDFGLEYDFYDLVLTGDLSKFGKELFVKYLEKDKIKLSNYNDCGCMIYGPEQKNTFAGGSGCGCVSSVTLAYILKLINDGKISKVLVLATGALLNPVMTCQKETIPSICHAVAFERCL